jgi:glucokinase
LQERDKFNWEVFDQAVNRLERARRVDIHAVGHAAAVAHDAQYKFMRMGVPCAAYTDQRLQALAVSAMGAGDVVIVISSAGRLPHLLNLSQQAQSRGASVIAITASQSPLAKISDVCLAVDHAENLDTHVAMVSRILQLLVIDVMAVSLATRRHGQSADDDLDTEFPLLDAEIESESEPEAELVEKRGRMGVATARPLSQITSHGV